MRLLLLTCLATLAFLGWRCGGALVGGYVGGGSVVAGWGEEGGMDLSAIWDKPSWGGQRQGGAQTERNSAFGAQKGGGARDGVSSWRPVGLWEGGRVKGDENLEDVVWSGQLMQVKDGADGDWDVEDMDGEVNTDFAPQTIDADGVVTEARDEMQDEVEDEVQQSIENPDDEALDTEDQEMPEEQYEAYEPPAANAIVDGPVGELTGPDEGADASAQEDNINTSQLETLAYVPSSTTKPSSG
ncbi:hypothetical protein EJ07DRAFT_158034 [Lizonia empirigonia]|nr:hypothetical protein EJ07DRAFT_158034 [Lizonia empirigonia]